VVAQEVLAQVVALGVAQVVVLVAVQALQVLGQVHQEPDQVQAIN
ncbi:MAG: hypothetical protein ICV51_22145, partial [Flavisolibacter sp.]|nr:hypothetical protein [Flavisolibacter sp.]